MRLLGAVPTFLVDDVGSTAEWYVRELGFSAATVPDAPPFAYASLQRDGAEIMLLRQAGYRKPEVVRASGAWDAYLRTEGLQELYAHVAGKPFVAKGLTRQSYGDTELEIRDPNGYVLVFGERVG
jgi:catechol 2,3-dioxygenase-like lactoylglutathione lyase family enzyme